MTRTFSTPEYHVIYDAGPSGIRATFASFTAAKDSKIGAAGTHIAVAGVGYDRTMGGIELDRRMREFLIDAFNTKTGEDVREDKRGIAKPRKETPRVNAILVSIMRQWRLLEAWLGISPSRPNSCALGSRRSVKNLKNEFAKPIEDALKNARLTPDNVTSVIFTGGSTTLWSKPPSKLRLEGTSSSKFVFCYL
jgi:hypoxia up-regulated 1